jgi:hypothetical protein
VANLSSLTSGVWKTGDAVYFISPTLISSDGRGASQPGSAPFAGQVFFNPAPGTVGNLQRRMFDGPWEWSWHASIKKSFVYRERHRLDIRADLFNFMNHPTFYVYPATSGDYGVLAAYSSLGTPFTLNSTVFGQVDQMNYNPRVVQFGAYYHF